jgi:hypothetical protein
VYIARTNIKGRTFFFLRESFLENGVFVSRELLELGGDPRMFIHYPDGRSFYVDEAVPDALRSIGETVDYDDLERIFWPFVRPDVQRRYQGPVSRKKRDHECSDVSGVHIFDRRRMSFLRTGSMNQRHILKTPDKLYLTLTGKSRDELEQKFMEDEARLPSKEIKTYIYTIFDLQRHFNAIFAREMPQALDQEHVENHLLDDLCALNRDPVFWAGMAMDPSLHPYLIRYLILFFDTEYRKPRFLEDLEFERMNRRRYHRQTQKPMDQVYAEASSVFGVPHGELKRMGKREIQRMYRKKAREFHPDHGGSHERFIDLSRLYEELMARD